jgi:carbonyl reductase 1
MPSVIGMTPSSIVVTGATRGIGKAIMQAIVARPEQNLVYLGCRDLAAGAALAAEIGRDANVVPLVIDVTDSDSVAAAAAKVAAENATRGRHLDALINNAGVLLERDGCSFSSIIEQTLRVNFDGVVSVTESFLPQIRDGGHIINVSSGAGTRMMEALGEAVRAECDAADTQRLRAMFTRLCHEAAAATQPPGDTPVYGLSKAAVNCYTRLIAREQLRVRVNACSPGFCRTEIAGKDVVYTRQPKDARLGADVRAANLEPSCLAAWSSRASG